MSEAAVSPQQRRTDGSQAAADTDPAEAERRTYRTVRELVREMQSFRGRLADALRTASVTDDERVRRFLDDLERRDRKRRELLDQVASAGNGALGTWRQNLPTEQLGEAIAEVDRLAERARSSDDDLDLEAVVSSALAVESHAAEIYRAVAESISGESARELLTSLAEMSEAAAADRAWSYHESRRI